MVELHHTPWVSYLAFNYNRIYYHHGPWRLKSDRIGPRINHAGVIGLQKSDIGSDDECVFLKLKRENYKQDFAVRLE